MYLFVAIAIYDKRAKSVNIRNFKVLIFHPILMLCKNFKTRSMLKITLNRSGLI